MIDQLSISYANMKLNKTAWDHLMGLIDGMKEKAVYNGIDCISPENITGSTASYVKGVRDCSTEIKRQIEEAIRGAYEGEQK